jgi:hypothetical protein
VGVGVLVFVTLGVGVGVLVTVGVGVGVTAAGGLLAKHNTQVSSPVKYPPNDDIVCDDGEIDD